MGRLGTVGWVLQADKADFSFLLLLLLNKPSSSSSSSPYLRNAAPLPSRL
jgi:hypothetical protein